MATHTQAPAARLTETRPDLTATIRRHFLYESYEEIGRRVGVDASVVEGRFRELYECGIRAKRLEVRRAYIARCPRVRDEEIGR